MHGFRPGLLVGFVFLAVFGASYAYLRFTAPPLPAAAPPAPPASEVSAVPPGIGQGAPPPMPLPAEPPPSAESSAPDNTDIAAIEPGAGMPPAAAADPPGGGVPYAPSSTAPNSTAAGDMPPPSYTNEGTSYSNGDSGSSGSSSSSGDGGASLPPAYDVPPPPPPPAAAMPPAAHDPAPMPTAMPPAGAADPPVLPKGKKVLSYFQQTKTEVDTSKAFGFVLLPKSAVTAEEKQIQKQFCQIVLASLDYMTPGAVAAAGPRSDILATYWPIVASRRPLEINAAFEDRNCDQLLAWYDHKLARSLATKAGVAGLTGPLLITWPSEGASGEEARNPLIVDFSKANYEHATKTLQYWFRQLRGRPELWTDRIREGTIRAELADAVNDTAGVVLAVLYGKWDSVNAVATN